MIRESDLVADTKWDEITHEPIMTTLFMYVRDYYTERLSRKVIVACSGWKNKDDMIMLAKSGRYI